MNVKMAMISIELWIKVGLSIENAPKIQFQKEILIEFLTCNYDMKH